MVNKPSIFLTRREAIDAICIDFKQYDPQIMLFSEVLRLVTDDRLHLKREPGKNGAWINELGHTAMHWMEGPELIAFMCDTIESAEWTTKLLAVVSQRVFQSRVRPEVDPATGRPGIRIETQMEDFNCRQCGRCCRALDYHHEVTEADMDRLKASGREDITEWVEVTAGEDQITAYRIWVSPKTGQLVTPCPFLDKDPASNRWNCRIHDIKPGICRQYPVSRKHALMTGCLGFKRPAPKKNRT